MLILILPNTIPKPHTVQAGDKGQESLFLGNTCIISCAYLHPSTEIEDLPTGRNYLIKKAFEKGT